MCTRTRSRAAGTASSATRRPGLTKSCFAPGAEVSWPWRSRDSRQRVRRTIRSSTFRCSCNGIWPTRTTPQAGGRWVKRLDWVRRLRAVARKPPSVISVRCCEISSRATLVPKETSTKSSRKSSPCYETRLQEPQPVAGQGALHRRLGVRFTLERDGDGDEANDVGSGAHPHQGTGEGAHERGGRQTAPRGRQAAVPRQRSFCVRPPRRRDLGPPHAQAAVPVRTVGGNLVGTSDRSAVS